MNKSLLTILQYLFFLGLGVLFVWLTLKDVKQEQWQQIKISIQNARHWIIVPVVVMLLISHYSRALRWRILMEPLGYAPTIFNTWAAVMIGYLVNAGVPRLGEVVKCTLLSKYEKIRADRLVGTIVIERFIDVVCLGIVFLLALLFQWHIIGDYTLNFISKVFKDETGHLSLTKLVIILSASITFLFILYFLLKRFGHIDIVAKIKNVIKGIGHGLNSIRLIKHKAQFVFHTILIWLMYLLSTTAGLYALQETDGLGIGGGLTTLAVGSVGMIVTPGGIGAYPLFVAGLMGLYQLDVETTGTALGWLLWSVQTIIILGCGLIFSGLFSYHNKKNPVENRTKHKR
ncbi:MAG: lysylphosphatidylglycerol synthase transmembrane domain-containing protein [Chitinophagaceae bacterium]